MNLKLIIIGGALTFLLAFAGLLLVSKPPPPPPQVLSTNTGRLAAPETSYDFGTVSMAKGPVTKSFVIQNADSTPATATKLFTSCMCTTAKLVVADKSWGPFGMPGHTAIPAIAVEIAPGQTAEVQVTFDPAAHGPAGVGRIEREATLEQNGQSPLTLRIRAEVTP